MHRTFLLLFCCLASFSLLKGQSGFYAAVSKSLGTNQTLINGIQFSNHFSWVEGHPYLLDGQFREGFIQINQQIFSETRMRYNLYTQKLEIEYHSANGSLNQFMSVPEHVTAFGLGDLSFSRLAMPGCTPGFYQVISNGAQSCFIAWQKDMGLTGENEGKDYEFETPELRLWLQRGSDLLPCHSRRALLKAFEGMKRRELNDYMIRYGFTFNQPDPYAAEMMIEALFMAHPKETNQ